MNPAQQLSKSQLRMLAEIPYTAPTGATPEGQKLINELRMTPVQPNKDYDTCIEKLIRGKNPDDRRLNRGNRSRLYNKELLIPLIAEHMGHGSSVMPE